MRAQSVLCSILILLSSRASLAQERLQSSDLLKLRSVSAVEVSPDATRVAYTVENNDGTGRPYGQLWVMTLADGKTTRFGGEKEPSGNPTWSPDSQWIAYRGRVGDKAGLAIAHPDGSGARFLAEMSGTNSPLPTTGKTVAWSPDGKRIAFVSSVPGPETADATGDPIVITRYLYKPDAAEGNTRFNDNRRLHIFVVDVATGRIDQLTDGTHYEHSIDWSPNGEEIAFVSNREPNEDQFFNYDLFTLKLADKSIRRLTATENAEYRPRWSPDGKTIAYQATKRGLTDLETTMEDTHVWMIGADGSEPPRDRARHRQPPGRARVVGRRPRGAVHRAGARQLASLSPAARRAAAVSAWAPKPWRRRLPGREDRRRHRQRRRVSVAKTVDRLHALDAVESGGAVRRRPQAHRSEPRNCCAASGSPRSRRSRSSPTTTSSRSKRS